MRISSVVSVAIVQGLAAAATTPTVEIDAGTLQGGICTNNANAAYFKSIPFAQPPTGDLRFAAPRPYMQKYEGGSRNATAPSSSCIQFAAEFAETYKNSEDCLYVDIWAPANATKDSALPVRAWVYGGSETAGSITDPLYDGCNVPSTDALMISINYRLGPLGFLALEDAGIAGNQAVQDILLALQWIQDNIAAFGGDPKKVLLHGQSAGAANVFTIATLPQAPKLFSAVILQSGGGRDAILKDHAETLGQAFAKSLNCSITDSACLKSVSVNTLKENYASLPLLNTKPLGEVGISTINNYEFSPYVDGKIVPAQQSKVGVNVPAIFGSASQDGALFALAQYADAPKGPASATAKDYTTFLTENFGAAAPLIEQNYPLTAFNASPFPALTAIGEVLTESSYRCSAYRGANRAAAKGIPVWTYVFAHSPKCQWSPSIPPEALPLVGATHTSEIPFTLGNTKNLPQPDGNCTMSSDEMAIAAFMNGAWTSFAGTQKPTADSADWPAYGGPQNTDGVTFVNSTVVGKIDYSSCQLWDAIDAMQVAAANNGSYAGSGTNATGGNATSSGNSSTTAPAKPSMPSTVVAGEASGLGTNTGVVIVLGLAAASAILL
ncbi:MAG: hypothetical protein M4579_004252 [Chaenotheca gracillima]|nr:MAG: hypothetical protein M4579_004252 [Chaenotheca gracillima]